MINARKILGLDEKQFDKVQDDLRTLNQTIDRSLQEIKEIAFETSGDFELKFFIENSTSYTQKQNELEDAKREIQRLTRLFDSLQWNIEETAKIQDHYKSLKQGYVSFIKKSIQTEFTQIFDDFKYTKETLTLDKETLQLIENRRKDFNTKYAGITSIDEHHNLEPVEFKISADSFADLLILFNKIASPATVAYSLEHQLIIHENQLKFADSVVAYETSAKKITAAAIIEKLNDLAKSIDELTRPIQEANQELATIRRQINEERTKLLAARKALQEQHLLLEKTACTEIYSLIRTLSTFNLAVAGKEIKGVPEAKTLVYILNNMKKDRSPVTSQDKNLVDAIRLTLNNVDINRASLYELNSQLKANIENALFSTAAFTMAPDLIRSYETSSKTKVGLDEIKRPDPEQLVAVFQTIRTQVQNSTNNPTDKLWNNIFRQVDFSKDATEILSQIIRQHKALSGQFLEIEGSNLLAHIALILKQNEKKFPSQKHKLMECSPKDLAKLILNIIDSPKKTIEKLHDIRTCLTGKVRQMNSGKSKLEDTNAVAKIAGFSNMIFAAIYYSLQDLGQPNLVERLHAAFIRISILPFKDLEWKNLQFTVPKEFYGKRL